MVNLNVIEQKMLDDPEIDQSVKDTLPKQKQSDYSFENQPLNVMEMYNLLKERESILKENPELADLKTVKRDTPNIARLYEIEQKLLNLELLNEPLGKKVFKGAEAAVQGTWKSTANLLGLPVDLTNLIVGLGETGVRKVLNNMGFDVASSLKDSKLMSKEPFLGSTQVTEIFNNLGIETEYDKTRWFTRFFGRLGEELGFGLPIGGVLAKQAARPLDYLSKEMAVTTAAGVGAGGLAGTLIGAMATASLITLPGINLLAIGTVYTTLAGLATSAVTGGLVGALVGVGISPNDAEVYERELQEGAILITVEPIDDKQHDKIK